MAKALGPETDDQLIDRAKLTIAASKAAKTRSHEILRDVEPILATLAEQLLLHEAIGTNGAARRALASEKLKEEKEHPSSR